MPLRATSIINAAAAVAIGFTGLAGTAQADVTIQTRKEFSCPGVGNDHMYPCPGSSATVPARGQLRVAVRGSEGKLVKFEARNSRNERIGGPTSCIRVGDPSVRVLLAGASRVNVANLRAQLCEGGRVDVHATMYY